MDILIIEDDSNKLKEMISLLDKLEKTNNKKMIIKSKSSYQSGLCEIFNNTYDLLLLDMTIPNFEITLHDDGGDSLDLGGELIIQEMNRDDKKIKTIIVTQYEEFNGISLADIDNDLKENYSDFYLGYVSYNASETTWKNELEKLIMEYI